MKLQGKVAIIAGSSKRIGEGCARLFARQGGAVLITSRQEEECRLTAGTIVKIGGRAIAVQSSASTAA